MSILTELEAALEAKREAEAALRVAAPKYKDLVLGRAWPNRRDDLYDLLTDDTIAALVAVAEAQEAACADCLEYRHPDFLDITVQSYCRDALGCRFADARAALAPLVKEER